MPSLPKVAYFDDDHNNLKMFSQMFGNDFSIEAYQNPSVYETALRENQSAILIDVLMPGISGFDLFEKIKNHESYNGCPIFFISGCDEDVTKIKSFDNGGVDFFSKLMKKEEMLARLNNKIRSFESNRNIFILDNLKVDLNNFTVKVNQNILDCTLIEFRILKSIIQKKSEFLTKEELALEVWGNQTVLNPTVNTHMSNLRLKVADWNYEILFTKNRGYSLQKK